jgi:hypothetical protein
MKPWRDRMQQGTDGRNVSNKRMPGVELNPLAEVGIGMLMPVVVRRRQLVMDSQGSRERRDHNQEQ